MKKVICLLCVAVMMMMTFPALANPSVTATVIPITEGVTVTAKKLEEVVVEIQDETAKSVVASVNGEGAMTPAEAVTAVLSTASEEKKAELTEALEELKDYSFASQFNEISFEGDTKEVEIEGTTADTRIMLIHPVTGEVVILKPDKNGKFIFPFEGLFAVMEKTPADIG